VGGSSSCSSQLSPCGGSAEMIGDGRSDTDGKVLVKGVGENLLPTTRALGFRRLRPPVAAPSTGNSHTDLFRDLIPAQALVTEFHDLLCRGGMSLRAAATQGDASTVKLMAHGSPGNAQLGTDLAQV
jgi:hypothetical protein